MDRQKISTDTESLKLSTNSTCIFITFHPITAEYVFFSSTHGTFFRTDYILSHKNVSINLKREKYKVCSPTTG